MAKTTAQKPKGVNGNSAEPAPESLDQVRDILFGGQMRAVDNRLRGLEERLLQEQTALRNEFERRVAEMDGAIRKELAAQAERLAAERTKRADDLKAISAEFKEAARNLERRHQKLEEAATTADAELRDQLLKQSAALSGELTRTAERLSGELDRTSAALRTEKLDTAALAAALTDMAARLTGTARTPGSKGPSRT